MNLSLEVKKFSNNERIGDYVSVVLPSELPVERAEVREVNKDRSAAHNAKSIAENKARAAAKARERYEITYKQREDKLREIDEAESVLEEIVAQQRAMQPDLDKKRSIFEDASADYEEKKNVYELKRGGYEAASSAFTSASEAEKEAEKALNDCRAKLTFSEAALASAKEEGTKHEGRLSSARGESAELKVLSEKARAEAAEASRLEADKKAKFDELSEETARLLAVMKKEITVYNDAQKAVAAASRDYSKAYAEHSAAIEALSVAENAVINSSGDNESLKAKAASQKSKTAAAASRLETANANKVEAEHALNEAGQLAAAAEMEYNRSNELLTACREEYEKLRENSARASSRASEAEAKYLSVTSGFEKTKTDLENNTNDIKKHENDIVESRRALLNAESELKRSREITESCRVELNKTKEAMDEKSTVMKQSEAVYNSKKNSFETINSSYQMAESDRKAQKSFIEKLKEELRMIEEQLKNTITARDNAISEAESSEAEAERRRLSVRTINAKYETIKIHFIQQGCGEDLILIHSVGQSLYTFRELINKLSSKFRVTALDLVGLGYSEKPYYFSYTMEEMTEFIYRFMEAVGIDYTHFFGFSMGAGYLISFAKKYPDKVGKLVLLSPGGVTPEMPMSIRAVQNRIFGGVAAWMINYRTVKKLLSECYFDLTNNSDDVCDEYYKPIANGDSKRIIRAYVSNYDDERVIHTLRDVNADTLILWGNEDKWHPLDMAEMFRSVMPSVNFMMIRNAGHLAHEEKAERVAQVIKQFIPCGYDEQEEERMFQ